MEKEQKRNLYSVKKWPQHEQVAVSCRLALQKDVPFINALYQKEYGREYPSFVTSKSLSDPDAAVLVAVDASDSVVGVGQITRLKRAHGSYELNGLVVAASHRGHKIGKLLLEQRVRMLHVRRARVAYSEPVCREKECRSQHNLVRAGFVLTGMLPLKYPDELVTANQPESVGIGVLPITKTQGHFGLRPLYLPDDYRAAIATVVEINSPTHSLRGSMPQVVEVPALIAEGRRGSSFVEIPINWIDSRLAITHWRSKGYLFAGVLPGVYQTSFGEPYDVLVMYKPPVGVQIDFSSIHVIPKLKKLHQFCKKEYENYSR